jgi:hypothetical protein
MPSLGLDPETALLLDLCARARGLRPALPASPGAAPDWLRLVDIAERHKVSGLLYRAMAEGLCPPPPPEAREAAKRAASAKAAISTMLISEWKRLLAAFETEGVRVLMIKGPALALQLYGDPRARDFRDIDLLIRREDSAGAARAFASRGYLGEANGLPPGYRLDFAQAAEPHIIYTKPGFPLFFELHRTGGSHIGLAPIDPEAAFARALRPEGDGVAYPTLCPADHGLLVLCHGAKHTWCILQWILDCQAFLGDPSLTLAGGSLPSWGRIEPARCFEAFALLSRRLFGETGADRYQPTGRARTRRATAIADFSLRALAEPERAARPIASMIDRGRSKFLLSRTRRGAILAFFVIHSRPGAEDLKHFPSLRLPIAFFYVARPFFVAVRKAARARCWLKSRLSARYGVP